jgi:hypothetical protein
VAVASLLTLGVLSGCSDSKDDPASGSNSGGGASDSGLKTCLYEQDLRGGSLPCDCFGHEANETTIVDPNCQTQVVCCPSVSNLRCEDHEYADAGTDGAPDAAPDAATDAAPDAATDADALLTKCKNEVDLSKQSLPCDCYGTAVEDVKTAMPSCSKTVVCCPGTKGLKCE